MRTFLALLTVTAFLAAEDIQVQSNGSVTPSVVPGFILVTPGTNPPVTHHVRVGAISQIVVPRADRLGDVTVIVVPGATDTLKFMIPIKLQSSESVLKAIADAAVASGVPGR